MLWACSKIYKRAYQVMEAQAFYSFAAEPIELQCNRGVTTVWNLVDVQKHDADLVAESVKKYPAELHLVQVTPNHVRTCSLSCLPFRVCSISLACDTAGTCR